MPLGMRLNIGKNVVYVRFKVYSFRFQVSGFSSFVNSQVSEVAFYWDTTIFVFVVFIEVYPMTKGVHRGLGGMLQGVSILLTAYNDGREDVSRSRELDRGGLSPPLSS